jgi:hypothetical protein
MKQIPDFDIELAQTTNYILGSPLAKRVLEDPPFRNYTNIVICILENIDRLADNCHMPEFTNHALPHICSIVRRASEWGENDGWIEKITSGEAGYLLLALLIHDIGMLSQDVKDMPEQDRLLYMKGFSDISNWVRRTHVIRIDGLTKRLLRAYLDLDEELEKHLDIAIGIARSHATWPWEKNFISNASAIRSLGLSEKRIRALNAIVAVCDLLDEDANRCDTVTLIAHRHGTTENMAHWLRHAITVEVSEVNDHAIRIRMRRLIPQKEHMELVYGALRNHYRLIRLYNEALAGLGAAIDRIGFEPEDGVPEMEDEISRTLCIWEEIPELKDCLPEQLLMTFMPEALNQGKWDKALQRKLNRIGLESLDLTEVKTFIEPDIVVMPEEKIIRGGGDRKDRYAYAHQLVEEAYLNGNIGKVRHLCMSVLEDINYAVPLDEIYWALIFLAVCMKSDLDYFMTTRNYPNSLRPKQHRNRAQIITRGSAYRQLLDVLFAIQEPQISQELLEKYAEHLYTTKCAGLKDDLATLLLIQTVTGMFWFFEDDTQNWIKIADFFAAKLNRRLPSMKKQIADTKNRLILQKEILRFPDKEPAQELLHDGRQMEFAKSWIDFYGAKWGKVKERAVQLANAARRNQDYCCTAQGYLNLAGEKLEHNVSGYEKSPYDGMYTRIYRYQRISMEQPLPSFWKEREEMIETLAAKCKEHPLKGATERIQILRLAVLRQLDALRYWNLGEYIESVRNLTMYHYVTAVYYDKRGNYCGFKENLPRCVTGAISSLDRDFFDEKQQKKIVDLMMEHDPKGLDDVVSYITECSPALEWSYAAKWLPMLAERMEKQQAGRVMEWTLTYDGFIRKQKLHFDLGEYGYLRSFVEKGYLDEADWKRMEPIFSRLFQSAHMLRSNAALCEAVLVKAPKEMTLQYLSKIAAYEENPEKQQIIYSLCILMSNQRSDMTDELHAWIAACDAKKENPIYKKIDALIDVRHLAEIQTIDMDGLKKILSDGLEKLRAAGVNGFDSRMLQDVIEQFQNQNWTLASDEAVGELVQMITGFFEQYSDGLNVLYFWRLCELLHEIERMCSENIMAQIVSYFIAHYVGKETEVLPPAKTFGDSPLNMIHMDFGDNGMYEQSVMMILLSGIGQIKDAENQKKCILWSIRHTRAGLPAMYQYTTILCSCFYFMGENANRELALAGLMLVRGSLESEDDKWEERKKHVETALQAMRESKNWFGAIPFEERVKADAVYEEIFLSKFRK